MMTLKELKEKVEVAQKSSATPKAANHATVFPLHSCGEYNYEGVSQESQTVEEDWFDNENWYVRLMLEGEDRISNNMDKKY